MGRQGFAVKAKLIFPIVANLTFPNSTVFLSTHVLEVAECVCDRVGILDRGRLVALGRWKPCALTPDPPLKPHWRISSCG